MNDMEVAGTSLEKLAAGSELEIVYWRAALQSAEAVEGFRSWTYWTEGIQKGE